MPSRWVDRNSSANTINIELKTVKDNPNPLQTDILCTLRNYNCTGKSLQAFCQTL
jgi:hypothetical protein